MADIAKLGGTAIGDLSKFGGVDISNLAKIGPLDVISGFTPSADDWVHAESDADGKITFSDGDATLTGPINDDWDSVYYDSVISGDFWIEGDMYSSGAYNCNMGFMPAASIGDFGENRAGCDSPTVDGAYFMEMYNGTVCEGHYGNRITDSLASNGDTIRLERDGSDLKVWVNGVLEHTESGITTADMYLWVSLDTDSEYIENLQINS